jgi:homoserine dehydrogenase
MNAAPRPTRVGLLGVGTVGGSLARLLDDRADLLLAKALVRDPSKPRGLERSSAVLTTDADEVLDAADVLVETMGGTDLAVDLMLAALERGMHVVTANKAALAERWEAFLPALREGRLHFEAAVMAGTPAIGPLSGVLRGSAPIELHAILNGTCSFILARLEQGVDYASALAEAQRLGYAEADPSLDVGGIDAAHKLAILARLSVDPDLPWEAVRARTHGIERLTPGIVHEAMEDGGRVQLVGSIVPGADGWQARVRPVYLPAGHPLASAEEAQAALLYRGVGGRVLILGPGAGGVETAVGVLGDLLDAAAGRPGPRPLDAAAPLPGDVAVDDLGELEPA